MAKLSNLQRAFIDQYFLCGMNATEAILQAGYKAKSRAVAASMGAENLRKPHIRAEIDNRLNENAMQANEVLFRLSEIARASHGDFWKISDSGFPRMDLKQAEKRGKLHLLKKVKVTQSEHGANVEIELHDAQSALVQLGRYYKLFTDKIEIQSWESEAVMAIKSGEIDYVSLSEEFGDDLATDLFRQAGVIVAQSG